MKQKQRTPILIAKSIFKGGELLPETDQRRKHDINKSQIVSMYLRVSGKRSIDKSEERRLHFQKCRGIHKSERTAQKIINFTNHGLENWLDSQKPNS